MGVLVRVRVVIQARTDSTRFPAKSLVSLGGLPLAILVAKRAANRGRDVVVATSSRAVDDELVVELESHKIPVVRGSYSNVRQRILAAVWDLEDGDLVVRLTADNPAPDGDLINQVVDDFVRSDVDHIETSGHSRVLPYGMSVEVCRAGALRRSCEWRDTPADREHVTLALRELGRSRTSSVRSRFGDVGNLRCTIDSFQDWSRMSAVFGSISSPIDVSWEEVIARLRAVNYSDRLQSHLRPILGTAQLTRAYGSVIKVEPPREEDAIAMLRQASLNGFWIDTARSYGDAEQMIGDAFRKWTATPPRVITKCIVPNESATELEIAGAVRRSVEESSKALGFDTLPVVLLHNPEFLDRCDGAAIKVLESLRQSGRVDRLGVSIDGPDRLVSALENPNIHVIQLAYNLLDHRWLRPEITNALRNRPNVELHCRSVFLQGVLLRDAQAWPKIKDVNPDEIIQRLSTLVIELKRKDIIDLCLAWISGSNPLAGHLTGVVLGAESLGQLRGLIETVHLQGLTETEVGVVTKVIGRVSEQLLNPALWPRLDNN